MAWASSAPCWPARFIGALLAVFAIKYYVNQVILGVVLNVFALGLTGLVLRLR